MMGTYQFCGKGWKPGIQSAVAFNCRGCQKAGKARFEKQHLVAREFAGPGVDELDHGFRAVGKSVEIARAL
jgi:hypothetical protein